MSRIGKRPIAVPKGVTVTIGENNLVTVKGPKGQLIQLLPAAMQIAQQDGELAVTRPNDEKQNRGLHGLTRTLLANMVQGVNEGFQKVLEINGVGYRAAVQGKTLNLSLGFSHPVVIDPPAGITFSIGDRPTIVIISGPDKQLVGDIAANIRKLRPPEPYLGKGIKYQGEIIRRKAGKAGKTGKGAKK